jgi:hypothetical protein
MFPAYNSVPPFSVQYLCPRQSPYWQGGKPMLSFWAAVEWAKAMKPNGPFGKARGVVVFQV